MKKNHIIIPTDLSEVAQRAIDYAGLIGSELKSEVTLIHIVPEMPGEENRNMISGQRIFRELEKTLQGNVNDLKNKFGLKADFLMKEGSIFEQISEAATDVDGGMIIIGTHGKKPIQYITGSYLAKVIASSKLPVLVVKKESHVESPKHLFVGLDFEGSSEKMLQEVSTLATAFSASVSFMCPENARGALLEVREMIEGKVAYPHEFLINPNGGKDFTRAVCNAANEAEGGIAIFKLEEPGEKARFKRLERLLAGNPTNIPVVYVYGGK